MRIARHVRKLTAYTPGEQPKVRNVLKLNTNENPYPPAPVCKRVLATFDLDNLRRYPDPDVSALRHALAELHGTNPENVFIGNGSDEVLALAARAFVEDDECIASLSPSYSLYKTLAAIRDVKWVEGGDGFTGDVEPSALNPKTALFLWANPNAPTGTFAEPEAIAAFARKFKGVLIVDEAYADFARANCMDLATRPENRNLIVMRTFSKSFSLAGLRVGYCVGPTDLIAALGKVKDSYNVDALAQAVALAAVRDIKWMRANAAQIVTTRQRFIAAIARRGWDVLPSEANFVFAKPPKPFKALALFNALRARQIYLRYFNGRETGDRLRITIGTDSQMNKLLKAIDELSFQS